MRLTSERRENLAESHEETGTHDRVLDPDDVVKRIVPLWKWGTSSDSDEKNQAFLDDIESRKLLLTEKQIQAVESAHLEMIAHNMNGSGGAVPAVYISEQCRLCHEFIGRARDHDCRFVLAAYDRAKELKKARDRKNAGVDDLYMRDLYYSCLSRYPSDAERDPHGLEWNGGVQTRSDWKWSGERTPVLDAYASNGLFGSTRVELPDDIRQAVVDCAYPPDVKYLLWESKPPFTPREIHSIIQNTSNPVERAQFESSHAGRVGERCGVGVVAELS